MFCSFNSFHVMSFGTKLTESVVVTKDFLPSPGTSASTASGNGMRDVGKTLDGLSALMRGTANLMEQGTGTMLKIRDHFN